MRRAAAATSLRWLLLAWLAVLPALPSRRHHVLMLTTDQEAQPLLLRLAGLLAAEHRVSAVVYGGPQPAAPAGVQLQHVPTAPADPAADLGWLERWERHTLQAPDAVVASRAAGCSALRDAGLLHALQVDLVVTTLYLDDACVLRLVADAPVLGVLTSSVGVPWVTLQLGGHFPVGQLPVHGYPLAGGGLWARLGNVWRWWAVQRLVQRQYQAPVAAAAGPVDLSQAYDRVAAVYVSGDARLQRDVPSDHRLRFLGCVECATFGQLPQSEMVAVGSSGLLVLRLHHPYVTLPEKFTAAVARGVASSHLMTVDVSNVTSTDSARVVHSTAPAADALAHPRARVFVSECSAASVLLAVHFSVPLVCVPFTAGHRHAAARAVALGLGLEVDRRSLTADSLRAAIVSVTTSIGLRRAMRTRADVLRHDIVSPEAQFAHDVHHVLQFGGGRRQRDSAGMIQYYCLDVAAACLASGAAIVGMVVLLIGCGYRALSTRSKAKTN